MKVNFVAPLKKEKDEEVLGRNVSNSKAIHHDVQKFVNRVKNRLNCISSHTEGR